MRAALCFNMKDPKFKNVIFLPSETCSVIVLNTASKAADASVFERPVFSEMEDTNSGLRKTSGDATDFLAVFLTADKAMLSLLGTGILSELKLLSNGVMKAVVTLNVVIDARIRVRMMGRVIFDNFCCEIYVKCMSVSNFVWLCKIF